MTKVHIAQRSSLFLYAKGTNRILEKVGEEATETIIAAKDVDGSDEAGREQARAALVAETADLWFHTLVMLAHEGRGPQDVLTELERRFGLSGHAEKARRDG